MPQNNTNLPVDTDFFREIANIDRDIILNPEHLFLLQQVLTRGFSSHFPNQTFVQSVTFKNLLTDWMQPIWIATCLMTIAEKEEVVVEEENKVPFFVKAFPIDEQVDIIYLCITYFNNVNTLISLLSIMSDDDEKLDVALMWIDRKELNEDEMENLSDYFLNLNININDFLQHTDTDSESDNMDMEDLSPPSSPGSPRNS